MTELPSWLDDLIAPCPVSGCWHWAGAVGRLGYGRLGPRRYAHRVVYERLVGAIPDGHGLHHRCGVRACVNPAHLVPMRQGDHARLHRNRAKSPANRGA
jgi:hypothetical protein